ncbi:glycosyltransferase family 2 protein [bacterium]|nr:glycosyltransferase family 2 protein [bacterium]
MCPDVSVVIPFRDEEGNAGPLVTETLAALRALGRSFELILVDDGSRDRTREELVRASAGERAACVVRLRKSFGQTAAIAAGIDRSRGRTIVTLDGDGQNDPRDIARLLERLEAGADVVSGWRRGRKDAALTRRLPSWLANKLAQRVSGVRLHDLGCALKAYRREVIAGVRLYGEMHRFLPIYASWQGAEVAEVEVSHRERRAGRSKYGLERTFKVLLDLVVLAFLQRYSTRPIYVFGGFGLVSLFFAFVAGAGAVAMKLAPVRGPGDLGWHKDFVQTPLPLLVVLLGVTGILSILMGLLAEMVMRTYFESQGKPVYVVRDVASGEST